MNWLIVAPDYTEKSAGVEVLHTLIHRLNKAGENAFTYGDPKPGYLYGKHTWMEDVDAVVLPDVSDPIIVEGLSGATKVRYCLYYPGGHGRGPTEYHEEIQFTFDKKFLPNVPEFYINTIDKSIFYDYGYLPSEKQTSAVYLGKGNKTAFDLFCKRYPQYFRLTRTEPTDQHNLAGILNASDKLYSFDTDTRLLEEAALCGCEVKITDGKGGWADYEYQPREETDISVMIEAVKAKRG